MKVRLFPCCPWAGIVGLVLLTAFAATAQTVYNFNSLTTGQALAGQDNWQVRTTPSSGGAGINVVSGPGFDTTTVVSNGLSDGFISRLNDVTFSFDLTGTETGAAFQYDGRLSSGFVFFGLGRNFNDDNDFSEYGFSFGANGTTPIVLRSALSTFVLGSGTVLGVAGDWISFRFLVDFTANSGDGAGSMSFKNLTRGDAAFASVPNLQNVALNLNAMGAGDNPDNWNGMYLRIGSGGAIDNIALSSAIPEPSSSILLVSGVLIFGLATLSRASFQR